MACLVGGLRSLECFLFVLCSHDNTVIHETNALIRRVENATDTDEYRLFTVKSYAVIYS